MKKLKEKMFKTVCVATAAIIVSSSQIYEAHAADGFGSVFERLGEEIKKSAQPLLWIFLISGVILFASALYDLMNKDKTGKQTGDIIFKGAIALLLMAFGGAITMFSASIGLESEVFDELNI